MLRFFIILALFTSLYGSEVQRHRWLKDESYLLFLERVKLPIRPLYYNLDKDDQRLTEEMRTGIHYQILRDEDGEILQALLPLNDELQIHIYKEKR